MIYALWHGGHGYSVGYVDDDTETFPSPDAARQAFRDRLANRDGHTPGVDESSSMTLWHSDPRGEHDPYPDAMMTFGPRGGVQVMSA